MDKQHFTLDNDSQLNLLPNRELWILHAKEEKYCPILLSPAHNSPCPSSLSLWSQVSCKIQMSSNLDFIMAPLLFQCSPSLWMFLSSRLKKSTNESGFGGWLLAILKLQISHIFKVALSWRFNWNLPTQPPSKFQWKLGHKNKKDMTSAHTAIGSSKLYTQNFKHQIVLGDRQVVEDVKVNSRRNTSRLNWNNLINWRVLQIKCESLPSVLFLSG